MAPDGEPRFGCPDVCGSAERVGPVVCGAHVIPVMAGRAPAVEIDPH